MKTSDTETTRRRLLIGAAAVPFAAAIPAAAMTVDPDADLLAALGEIEALRAEEGRLLAIREEIAERIDTAAGREIDAAIASVREALATSPSDVGIVNDRLERMRAAQARRDAHPDHGAEEAAHEAYDAVLDARIAAEERFRRLPAQTLRGVLEKLRNLASDCCWRKDGGAPAEPWITEPVEQAIADLERIVAGRAAL
jgi:hypothetical protein